MKSILKQTLFIFLAISLIGCNHKKTSKTITENGEINVVTPAEFKEKSINQTVLDIRTPQEFASGHIEGAININLFDKTFETKLLKFDKTKPLFIYCRSGNRTTKASKRASNLGFEEIYDLQGGLKNWVKKEYKIIK